MIRRPPRPTLFPYTPRVRSRTEDRASFTQDRGLVDLRAPAVLDDDVAVDHHEADRRSVLRVHELIREIVDRHEGRRAQVEREDRKSTRLNSSHLVISYAVFC